MRDIYFKDTNVIWHTKWSSWAPLSLYKHFLSLAEFPAICPAPKTTVSTVRGTEINLWLLWVPYNINSSVLVELLCPYACVCRGCFCDKVSQSFSFLSPFSLLLQHLPASQLSDSSAPCFSAFWLTCSSLLFSTLSFMPRGSPHSLPLSCFHF